MLVIASALAGRPLTLYTLMFSAVVLAPFGERKFVKASQHLAVRVGI